MPETTLAGPSTTRALPSERIEVWPSEPPAATLTTTVWVRLSPSRFSVAVATPFPSVVAATFCSTPSLALKATS